MLRIYLIFVYVALRPVCYWFSLSILIVQLCVYILVSIDKIFVCLMLCIYYDTNSSQERYPLSWNVVYFYKEKYVRSGVLYTKKIKCQQPGPGHSHMWQGHMLYVTFTYMFTLNLLLRNCTRFITIRSRYYINCA